MWVPVSEHHTDDKRESHFMFWVFSSVCCGNADCPCRPKISHLKHNANEVDVMFILLFQSLLLSLYTHSVDSPPPCWLQNLIPSVCLRQVVCLIEIKLIIFPACAHAATLSCTFTRHYLSKVFVTAKHPFQIKGRKCAKTWHYKLRSIFFQSQRLPSLSTLPVCSNLKSAVQSESKHKLWKSVFLLRLPTEQVIWGQLLQTVAALKLWSCSVMKRSNKI